MITEHGLKIEGWERIPLEKLPIYGLKNIWRKGNNLISKDSEGPSRCESTYLTYHGVFAHLYKVTKNIENILELRKMEENGELERVNTIERLGL